MYEISCEMCEDLIPLVEDGVASEDSRAAVAAHLQSCPHCGNRPLPEPVPAADEKKALTRYMNRLKLIALAILGLGAVGGIVMVERFVQGSSMIFALVILLIGRMVYGLHKKKRSDWGRREWIRLLLAAGMTVGLLSLLNLLVGNPLSQFRAERSAEAYVQEHCPDKGYEVEKVTYNFLSGDYCAQITSPYLLDGDFELNIDRKGNITWDGYHMVTDGYNTSNRLYREYRELVDPILKKLNLETLVHIGYGTLQIDAFLLEPEGAYDILALGAAEGHLIVTVRDEEVTLERAEELLLRVEELMVEYGGAYYDVELTIYQNQPENTKEGTRTRIDFPPILREQITGGDLAELLREIAEFGTY